MDSSEDENPRVNVRSLVSAFSEKELSGISADSKDKKDKGKRSKTLSSTSGSVGARSKESTEVPFVFEGKHVRSSPSVCETEKSKDLPLWFRKEHGQAPSIHSTCASEMSSKDIPLHFKKKHEKTPSRPSICASEMSSKDIPLHFRKKHEKTPSRPSICASVMSSKDIPLHFRKKQWERDCNYSTYGSDMSSKDIPLHFANKMKISHGMPQHVYPVLRVDHRVPDDFYNRMKFKPPSSGYVTDIKYNFNQGTHWDHPEAGTTFSSETSDHSSDKTSGFGSKDSQNDEETYSFSDVEEDVICDICHQTAAVKTCLTCNASYCEYDVRQHYKVPSLQRHILADVSDEVEGKRCTHNHKSLKFICRTDQMQICSICAKGNHRGHDIVSRWAHHAPSQMSGSNKRQDHGPPEAVVPPPGQITFQSVKPNSVVLSWGSPQRLEGPKRFRVKRKSYNDAEKCFVVQDFHKVEIDSLQLGQLYFFSVATEDVDGNLSEWVHASVFTAVPAPRHLTKGHSEATAVSLKWTRGDKMEGIPHQFLITVKSQGNEDLAVYTEECYKTFSDLEPDTEYVISVSTVMNDQCSERVSTTIRTEPCLREVLSKIGLEDQFDTKLTLSTVLEINQKDLSENKLESAKSLPEAFLKKLMMLNTNARSTQCVSSTEKSDTVSPLDLITALFLCSDGFLQQNMVMKMSLCQFAVPLLLPNCETRKITMMLWSMREIIRSFKPSNQAHRKISCEERIVLSDIPLISFVRLGRTISSKSEILNKLLSNTACHHDIFYHGKMVCGDVPRRISDGLVEISWYLPCGIKTIDKFNEPLAVANLRGDIRAFDEQFSFLCQTSATVFIFCDESEAGYFKNLERKDVKAKFILISSVQGKTFTLKMMKTKPSLKLTNVSQQKKTDAELIKALQEQISKMLENCPDKVSIANLPDIARGCGFLVDEDSDECQSSWKNSGKITKQVANTSKFKDKQLPLQGHIWKELSWLETECWRLRKAADRNVEDYRKSLKTKEKSLQKKRRFEMTAAISSFLGGVGTSEVQRCYFLKWLEIDLDNLSRHQLSALQNQYKELNEKIPIEVEKISEIDKQISICSLRLEHFIRECGQLYGCASHLPEHSRQRKTMEQLPALCAQMLLDGFPLELVDGDAANIPMKWITEVLTELHSIMHSNSKLKVIAVIGAENSGKSTLLNSMFGVRFAVNKGTCTRGAFIQLINVNEDIRRELGCDCIMIIDTEGLKPHPMVQEDDSHERDREVATLAVALSDATIISLPIDKSQEKDVLEMVLHAFTRMKDEGKKTLCHFVHTSMSDMPTEKSKKSKEWIQQLSELMRKTTTTKKTNIKKISDFMEFDPDTCSWFLPPVWHGTPPMAPVSTDYSGTVQALKRKLIGGLKTCKPRGDLIHFISNLDRYWKAL